MKIQTLKRISSMFLAVLMFVSVIPLSALKTSAAGDSLKYPVICDTFSNFKAAMEDENITYVSLGNVEEVLPVSDSDASVGAIDVKGTKRLKLTGFSKFVAPTNGTIYDCLLQVTYDNELYIQGSGQLVFAAAGTNTSNAVIRNMGGRVIVYDGYLKGNFHSGTHSMAICQDSGELFIHGGFFYSENGKSIDDKEKTTCAVRVIDGTAYIDGGEFWTANFAQAEGYGYGLYAGTNAQISIDGGEYQGIYVPDGKYLSDYISEDLVMLYSGQKANPEDFGKITGNIAIEVYKEITSLDVNINAPSKGENISYEVYNEPLETSVHTVHWYEDGKYIEPGSNKFVAGKSYKVEIYLLADNNARFAKSFSSLTINYKNAQIIDYGNNKETSLGFSVDFGVCPDVISSVEFNIDAPAQNRTPDQYVECAGETYRQALPGENMYDTPLHWQESDDGKSWSTMKSTNTFTVGKYYRVFVDLMPEDGYLFSVDKNFEPLVTATVNGNSAVVSRYTEQDPETLISVCHDFGILNDRVIEEIRITEVCEPKVGKRPVYFCALSGIGYALNTKYSNDTYIINGIGWRDVTDDKWLYPMDTFQIGHEYAVYIDVKANDGYEFYTTGNNDTPAGWGYINDNYATLGVKSEARYEQSLSWTFTCQPRTANYVEVNELDAPFNGATPDFDVVTDSLYYNVESVVWYDCENDMSEMTSNDTFVGGNKYYVLITVVPTVENGYNLCKFLSGNKTKAILNGVEVKPIANDSWQDVTSSVKKVSIWYVFSKAASENDLFISGRVKTFGNKDDEVTLKLYTEDSFIPVYTLNLKGNNAEYHFASVDAGKYVLKVSKSNHVTAEYVINVENGSAIENVETWLYGDVTGDGVVDSTDYLRIKGHFLGTYKLDGLGLLSGDADRSGDIDSTDYLRIKGHFLGTYNLHN